ncbi:RNA polymerase sigma factor FliA [Halomonadaceae bacterium LMG 33818]|uniref:sigma-70 family RNA polymerase sigma factor n=1 Tax=Cernens ardua TaxID=3402176 RepID=UPI003EDC4E36
MSDISDRNPPDNNHYKKPSLLEASASVERHSKARGSCHSGTTPPDTMKYARGASRPPVWQNDGWQQKRHRYLPEAGGHERRHMTQQSEDEWIGGYSSGDYFAYYHETDPEYFRNNCVDPIESLSRVLPEAPHEKAYGNRGRRGMAQNRMPSSCTVNEQRSNDHADSLDVPCIHYVASRGKRAGENCGKAQSKDTCHEIDSAAVSSAPIQYHEPLDVLVEKMTPMIRLTARRLKAQSRIPMHVDMEDLIQAGTVGLIEASQRFNPKQGAAFETYAIKRIQGAMVDELRSSDWLPRSVRRHAREAEQIHNRLEQYYGGPIRERDVAAVMEVSLNAYNRHRHDVHNCQLLDYTDYDLETFLPEEEVEPLNRLLSDELHGLLQLAIASLDDDREREALTLYRLSGNSLRMIGERMGVSDSRVCQLHKRAMAKIRAWFQQYFPELEYTGIQGHGDLTADSSDKPITYRTYSFRGGPLPPRDD